MKKNQARYIIALLCCVSTVFVGCDFGPPDDPSPVTPKGPFVVLFEIDGDMPQFPGSGGLFSPMATNQHKLLGLLEKASADLLVQEVIIHFGAVNVGWARAKELSDGIAAVAKTGKSVTCHLEAADNKTYWMAARGCPNIVVSPAGGIDLIGLSMEAAFMKDLLDSMGVTADMLHVGKYKSAADGVTRNDMTEESRAAMTSMLDSLYGTFVNGIAVGRNLEPQQVRDYVDAGPYTAPKSLALKLVDRVSPLGQLLEEARSKYAGGIVDDYGKKPPKPLSFTEILQMVSGKMPEKAVNVTPRIALIPAVGPIVSGSGSGDLLGGMEVIADMAIIEVLYEAKADDSIKAVVIRIDSPGGSALASDNIWHAVRSLVEVKPVVISMGDVAASGGYYIASAGNEIFVSEATITGSIGVVGGKIVVGDALEKIGVHTETMNRGARSSMSSPLHPFTEDERVAVKGMMQEVYDIFVNRVVEGRGMERAKVLELAQGRVWTGEQALSSGLVDKLGTLKDAVDRARELAKLPGGPVEIYPKPKNIMEMLGEQLAEHEVRSISPLMRLKAGRDALAFGSLLYSNRVLAFAPISFEVR